MNVIIKQIEKGKPFFEKNLAKYLSRSYSGWLLNGNAGHSIF